MYRIPNLAAAQTAGGCEPAHAAGALSALDEARDLQRLRLLVLDDALAALLLAGARLVLLQHRVQQHEVALSGGLAVHCRLKDVGRARDREQRNPFFPPSVFYFFPTKANFSQTPLFFPHIAFQSLGYVMKLAAACRVCSPSVLG